jgi:uncharacterized protein
MSDIELIARAKHGNIQQARELLNSGADINEQDEQGWTPLNWAAARGNSEMVKLLLRHGAQVFRTGRDLRTPAMIALAAGHGHTAELLLEAEAQATVEKPVSPERKFCTAYPLKDFSQFSGWKVNQRQPAPAGNDSLADDEVAFLHQNYVVTQFIWDDQDIVFDQVTDEWKAFCCNVLQFKIPNDLNLAGDRELLDAPSKTEKAGTF